MDNMENMPVFLILAVISAVLLIVAIVHGRRADRRAKTDPVTGSLNNYGFSRKVRKFLSGKSLQYSIAVVKICNYRRIDQTFGSEKSEQVLREFYAVLQRLLSGVEPVARVNNGTFCFLIRNRQENAIHARLMRIIEHTEQLDTNSQIPYKLDLRFGVYIPPVPGESVAEMMEKASAALEEKMGAPRIGFNKASGKENAAHKWELICQMNQSVENGDFLVFLQPKVRLSDNRVVGAEAMIRWRHPQRGMLTPEMFMPIAEEYHMISRYEIHLFELVCRQLKKWADAGLGLCPVSLNLSAETASHDRFMDPFVKLAKKYQISPELIEFELSNEIQKMQMERIQTIIATIHKHNFHCALDNFGEDATLGLHLLRELEVDTIRLDHSLFSVENNNRKNRFAVEAIIKIAAQMQINTIATGIDNTSQVQYLKQAGCDSVQGVSYFRPLAAEDFRAAVYQNGELRYVDDDNRMVQDVITESQNASGNIVMFSLTPASDRVTFSNMFSSVLEGRLTIEGAQSLFRYSALIHENDRKDFFHLLDRCQTEDGWVENTIRFYTAKGRYEWLEVHLHREYLQPASDPVIFGTLVNMAGWMNEVDRWKEKANRDALTGLYNREYFEQFVSSAVEKGMMLSAAVVFIDIDDFKKVNDTLGHMVGDDVICWFAKRVLGTFRHTDIVARYGGDEFVVFVNGIGREELEKRLGQLCDSFRYPYRNGDIEYPASGSIGAAMFPDDGRTYLELLDRADCATYNAKHLGKNRFVMYRPGLEEAP